MNLHLQKCYAIGQIVIALDGQKLKQNLAISGQSYKAPMIVIYDSRVIPDLKLPHIMTL